MRKLFKRNDISKHSKIEELIVKYKIPREFLSINRKSVSKAMLIGFFWAFIPMPFQMFAVVLTAAVVRFNVPIAIALVWITNPITIPFIYYAEYLVGEFLFYGDQGINVELTIEWFTSNIDLIFGPLYLGAATFSLSTSIGSYFLITQLWKQSVHKEKKEKHLKRFGPSNKKVF